MKCPKSSSSELVNHVGSFWEFEYKFKSRQDAGLDNLDCRSTGGGLRSNIVSKCLDFKPRTHFSKGKGVTLMQRRQGLTKSMFGNNCCNCHVIIT